MKKIVTTIASLIGAHLLLTAGPVSPQQAKVIAEQILGSSSLRSGGAIELTYTHTPHTLRQGEGDAQAYYYIFNRGKKEGFAIISGDDRMYSVLAYADQGYFDMQNAPEHIKAWMSQYDSTIEQLLKMPDLSLGKNSSLKSQKDYPSIQPLLGGIKWNQDYPYNFSTPTDYTGQNMPTGCVATAAAQVMRYHKWPDQSVGASYTYRDEFARVERTASFGKKYNWDKMRDYYDPKDGTYTQENVREIGSLLRDIGFAAQMNYSSQASGAWEHDLVKTLRRNFKYDKSLSLRIRHNYHAKGWEELIQKELQAQRPVFYTGYGKGGGHAFVCDGYSQDGLYHFNWGWGGMADGYFRLTALKPSALGIGAGLGDYSLAQAIIVNFTPDKNGNSQPEPKLAPAASIRIKEPQDKSAILLSGNLLQRSEDAMIGTLRISVKNKDNATTQFSAEKKMIVNFRESASFEEPIMLKDYNDGAYELFLEWKETTRSEYEPLTMYIDEPDRVFFTVKDKKLAEWNYNVAMDNLVFDKTKAVANFQAFSSSQLTISIQNLSEREYYGPIKVLATPVNTSSILIPTGRELVIAEAVVCIPAKQTVMHTFDEFILNEYDGKEVNLFVQYSQLDKNKADDEFAHHTRRFNASYAHLCAEKIRIVRPADYTKTTLVFTPTKNTSSINIYNGVFDGPTFKVENRGATFSSNANSPRVMAFIVGEIQGYPRVLAVCNNPLSSIEKGKEISYTPEFTSNNQLESMKGKRVTIFLKSILNNQFADELLPLFGTTQMTTKIVSTNSIEATESVQLAVYPNPASTTLHISNATPISSIDIFSMNGELVLSQRGGETQEVTVNVNDLPEGNYLLGVRDSNNKVTSHRLVVSR